MSRAPRAMRAPEAPRFEDEPEPLPEVALDAGARLVESRLLDAELGGSRVPGLRMTDVVVERGNLANFAAPETSMRRVTFAGTRLTGAQWTRGSIADAVFHDCRIDLATFAGTSFERVAFEDCLLMQTDFREALLRHVRFDRCDLTGADLAGLRLDRCELRGCTLDGVSGLERLRGAAMPWADIVGSADAFAAALGIRILDEGER